jgi:integrase
MARKLRSAALENRTARLKLAVRKRPYSTRVAIGVRLAYRRNQGGGVWSVLKSNGAGGAWLQRFALADDHEESNGSTILNFWEATEAAIKLARGDGSAGEVDVGRPATVSEAIAAYERDLKARDAGAYNAVWIRRHLPRALMGKPVSLLTAREVRALRDGLVDKGELRRATVNRFMKALSACLNLAAHDDDRIANQKAWKIPALRDTANPRNVVITEKQVRDVVAAAYATGGNLFGAFVEILASTGVRPVQARRLTVADLDADHPDGARLHMPSSKKGRGKKRTDRTTLPIPVGLAKRLKAEATGRAVDESLLGEPANATTSSRDKRRFVTAAVAAGLPKEATAYALRHTFITSRLLKGIPVRLVAAAVDSSVGMLEATYSKHIANLGADLMRAALVDFDAPAPDSDNVVRIARRAKR